jgi:hypothetical protein
VSGHTKDIKKRHKKLGGWDETKLKKSGFARGEDMLNAC